jgi:excisionase family DNA binding protein
MACPHDNWEDLPSVMTAEEVAGWLRFNIKTVYQRLHKGDIKGFKVGNEWRINKMSLRPNRTVRQEKRAEIREDFDGMQKAKILAIDAAFARQNMWCNPFDEERQPMLHAEWLYMFKKMSADLRRREEELNNELECQAS